MYENKKMFKILISLAIIDVFLQIKKNVRFKQK